MTRPLAGIKVLDFSHLLPGELAASILSDLGAEITRIERLQPGLAQSLPPVVNGESLFYWGVHREEKRLGLNLKDGKAREIIYKLVDNSDILLENFRPGVMSRLGLGYGKLHGIKPSLIYCSISGYGQNTSWSQRPGHDLNLQAESGVLHISRQQDGRPIMPGTLVSDFMSANLAAISILSALFEQTKTRKGKHLDISMFDSALWTQCLAGTTNTYFQDEPRETTPAYRENLCNYNVFKCKDDRYLAAAPLESRFWETFCRLIERPDLIEVAAFGTNKNLLATLESEIAKKTLAQWMAVFEGADCCVSPVNTVQEAMEFLPAQERQLIQELSHPSLGLIKQIRTPLPFGQAPSEPLKASSNIAESSRSILKEIGYDEKDLEDLAKAGIIADEKDPKYISESRM